MDPEGNDTWLLSQWQDNFLDHYYGNRSPFGMWLHYTWISTPTRIQILKNFYAFLSNYSNVYFSTPNQVLAWMKNPVPASQLHTLPEFACPSLRPLTPSPEVCNGIDDDLNGLVDDGTGAPNYCPYVEGSFYTCEQCSRAYPGLSGVIPPEPGWSGYANFTIDNFGSSFCGTVEFYNPINSTSLSWTITFTMNNAGLPIRVPGQWSYWSSVLSNDPTSEYPHQFTITPLSWNTQIGPYEYNTDPGFCGPGSDVAVDPSSITVRFS